jgi:hypothetical protein
LFYTWPLKYVGLGELAVLVVWGPLMIGGGYYTIPGGWSWEVVLASLPYALGPTAIIFGKHLDKLEADKEKGIRTLPVLMGERPARYAVLGMMALQYLFIVYLVLTGFFTPIMLVVFLSLYGFFKLIACRSTAVPNPPACPRSITPTCGPCGSWPSPFCTTAASGRCSCSASPSRPPYGSPVSQSTRRGSRTGCGAACPRQLSHRAHVEH